MKKRNKYLLKNTIIFSIGNIATRFISFFLIPLYTNVLSTTQYGTVDLIYTVCTVLVPLLTLNIAEAILRFSLDKNKNQEKIISIGTLILIISMIVGLIIIPISNRIQIFSNYTIYFYFYFISLAASQIYLCNLKGQEKLVLYTVGNVIQTLLIAVLNVLFLLVLNLGIEGYFLAYIISNVITTIFAFFAGKVYYHIRCIIIDKVLLKEMLKYSIVLIPTSFMWWIMNSSDRIMVAKMISTSANGIYAVSYKLPTMISTIITTFTQAWLFSAIKIKDSKDNQEYTNNIFCNLFMVSCFIGIAILSSMKIFLKFYVAPDYYSAWMYIPYLIVGVVFQALATFVSTSYNVHKNNKGFLFSGLVGAIVNIILNILMIPTLGIAGAALATCLSYITVFVYRIIDTRKYVKINLVKKEMVISLLILLITAVTTYIDNYIGQILLIIELLLYIIINRKQIINLFPNKSGTN